PTAIGFGGYSLWTPDSRECGYSVRIQCVRLHDRAICTRGSPGPDKLESVCTGCRIGYFSLAPLASVNSVYLALWCVFRCLIKLLVLSKVLSFPPLHTVAVQILHCASLLLSSFILKCAQIAVRQQNGIANR